MESDEISTVRSFSRSVTRRVGVFTDRFLGRDRPLAEARLIFEISRDGREVRELRSNLGFDSGYLSRLLRSLERQDLIEVLPGEKDRRIRRVHLTVLGLRELAELDRRGEEFAVALLEPLSKKQRRQLVDAMADVERLLDLSATVVAPEDPRSKDAEYCLAQYYAELDRSFDQGFDLKQTITANPEETTPPHGVFLLARLDGRPIGCGVVKRIESEVGSVKRMWVDSSARGLGLGRRLLESLEKHALELGLRKLRLETNRNLKAAQHLYRRCGYQEVSAFNDDPYADFWFEKEL